MSSEAGAKSVAVSTSSDSRLERLGDVATEMNDANDTVSAKNRGESMKESLSVTQGHGSCFAGIYDPPYLPYSFSLANVAEISAGTNGSENKQQGNLVAQDKQLASTNNNAIDNQDNTVSPAAEGLEDISAHIVATPASGNKSKSRRKSAGVPEHKTKKPNKKASKAKLSHIDAKPGEHYYIKLKGYPLWPGIICDESMLPSSLISTRPVTAARSDGSYRADYEDGGKNVHDRTFPVMYLATNEL
jgi:PWWP domain